MWLAIVFIVVTILARLIPHVPNFSPLVAVALFSGVYLKKRWALIIPLVIYMVSDLIMGLHNVVLFTWGSMALVALIGIYLKRHKTPLAILSGTLVSSVVFFIVTNFGVWLGGWYTLTFAGLVDCFTLAIPFFRTSLLANIVYVGVLFGVYEFLSRKVVVARKQPIS
ncbi:MAG: hypothetical protein JXD21_03800 [Candidatus Omnitrophica bacterium]|nr:hypothetical protein [Candidatus Omnitrophota bacterium]